MTLRFVLLVLGVVLGGCTQMATKSEGPGPAALSTGLNTQANRMTDSQIGADRQTMDALQARLRRLNEQGVSQSNYSFAKAQCWLDTAWAQYHENDRTGYIEESLAEAQKIALTLEADKTAKVGYDTPLVARSTMLRKDLWARLSAFKMKESTLACNARTVACGEVRLVRAGHAEQQTGWRQATPHVQMVEDALRVAALEAKNCEPVVASSATTARSVSSEAGLSNKQIAPLGAVAMEKAAIQNDLIILVDALFEFDKAKPANMLPGSKRRIENVAIRLKDFASLDAIVITGYADARGDASYNEKLGLLRAQTIQTYLASLGVRPKSWQVKSLGSRELMVEDAECKNKPTKDLQNACRQLDRRVTIEASGILRSVAAPKQ
jgi:OOP family OmpA-OmpF porin